MHGLATALQVSRSDIAFFFWLSHLICSNLLLFIVDSIQFLVFCVLLFRYPWLSVRLARPLRSFRSSLFYVSPPAAPPPSPYAHLSVRSIARAPALFSMCHCIQNCARCYTICTFAQHIWWRPSCKLTHCVALLLFRWLPISRFLVWIYEICACLEQQLLACVSVEISRCPAWHAFQNMYDSGDAFFSIFQCYNMVTVNMFMIYCY